MLKVLGGLKKNSKSLQKMSDGKGEMRANDDCIGSTIASVVELKSPNNPESKKPDPKEIEKLNAKSAIYRTVQK